MHLHSKFTYQIRAEEWYAVILSFFYFLSILASYYVMRPLRDQLAAEAGSAMLPWFFSATLVATLIMTPLFSWVVSRWPRRIVMPAIYLFFTGCQLLFIPFFHDRLLLSPYNLGAIFFVWVSVFNLFVISVFWSFMTDIWSDAQARRLFPLIALGGTAGAIIGPSLTSILAAVIGLAPLLAVSAVLLLIAVFCILLLGDWAHKHGAHHLEKNSEGAIGGSMWDGLRQIAGSPFIRVMAVMMLLSDAIGTISYSLITDYSGTVFFNDPTAQTRFAANMDLFSNMIQGILQLTVTRWMLVRYGAGIVFAFCAVIIVFACLALGMQDQPYAIIVAGMPAIAVVQILTRSLAHGMLQPARETLYTLVPRELRYKGKNAVDTVIWRMGDVFSLLSIKGFRYLGVSIAGFGFIWAVLAAASGWLGFNLSNQVERGNYKRISK